MFSKPQIAKISRTSSKETTTRMHATMIIVSQFIDCGISGIGYLQRLVSRLGVWLSISC